MRIAWHLGNRHLPVQLLGDRHPHPRRPCDRRDMVGGLGRSCRRDRGAVRSGGGRVCGRAASSHDDDGAISAQCEPVAAACCTCWPGSRRRSRPAASLTRTGSNGRSRPAICATTRPAATGWPICWRTAPAATMRSCCATRTAPTPSELTALCALADRNGRRAGALAPRRWARATPSSRAALVWGSPRLAGLAGPVAYPVAVGALAGRSRHRGGRRRGGLSSGVHQQSDLRGGAPGAARPDRRLARARRACSRASCAVARETRSAALDDIGGCAFRADIAAMRHETQHTRLFRS